MFAVIWVGIQLAIGLYLGFLLVSWLHRRWNSVLKVVGIAVAALILISIAIYAGVEGDKPWATGLAAFVLMIAPLYRLIKWIEHLFMSRLEPSRDERWNTWVNSLPHPKPYVPPQPKNPYFSDADPEMQAPWGMLS